MAFCGKCGTQMEDGAAFCSQCGAPIGSGAPETGAPAMAMAQSDAEQNKVMGVLAYLGFLCLVPIFAAKDSKFARFHANQGLVLFVGELAYAIVYSILSAILWSLAWSSWTMFNIVSALTTILGLVYIVFGVLAIIGIVNAVSGKEKPLPVIGKFIILK